MSAAAGAAVVAAIANAIKASGVLVRVSPENFANILRRVENPLIVYSQVGLFTTRHQYLTSYKGLAFYTKSREQIDLPRSAEVITAQGMWMPG